MYSICAEKKEEEVEEGQKLLSPGVREECQFFLNDEINAVVKS